VFNIIQKHGGTIKVSHEGRGTTFDFLPKKGRMLPDMKAIFTV
jgi:hypothetical protein